MRILISIAILVLTVVVSANGQALRNLNGTGTNISFRGNVNILDGIGGLGDATQLTNTGPSLGIQFDSSANPFTAPIYVGQAGVISFMFTGNGAGLTNLGANQPIVINTNVTINNTLVVSGKATFTSNVTFRVMDFFTNSHPSSGVISLTNSYGAFATNNNTTFTGLAGKDVGATNMQSLNLFITNSSAAAKTIVMDASFQNMRPEQGSTLFFTNVGHLLVFHYPGMATNFYFLSR